MTTRININKADGSVTNPPVNLPRGGLRAIELAFYNSGTQENLAESSNIILELFYPSSIDTSTSPLSLIAGQTYITGGRVVIWTRNTTALLHTASLDTAGDDSENVLGVTALNTLYGRIRFTEPGESEIIGPFFHVNFGASAASGGDPIYWEQIANPPSLPSTASATDIARTADADIPGDPNVQAALDNVGGRVTAAEAGISYLQGNNFFVVPFFRNSISESLHFAISGDGISWKVIAEKVFTPSSGGFRDPSVIDWNGYYWIAYTSGGFTDHTEFKIAKTADLKSFEIITVDMSTEAGAGSDRRVWAPDWVLKSDGTPYLDGNGRPSIGVMVRTNPATNVLNSSIYVLTAATSDDLTTFATKTQILEEKNDIHIMYDLDNSTFYGWYRAYRGTGVGAPTGTGLGYATATSLTGTWTVVQDGLTDFMGAGSFFEQYEGVSVVKMPNGKWRIYADHYTGSNQGLYYTESSDLTTWSTFTILDYPYRFSHGTFRLQKDAAKVQNLLNNLLIKTQRPNSGNPIDVVLTDEALVPASDATVRNSNALQNFILNALGGQNYICASDTTSHRPVTYFTRVGGTPDSPTASVVNQLFFSIIGRGFDGTNYFEPCSIDAVVSGTVSANNIPAGWNIRAGTNSTREIVAQFWNTFINFFQKVKIVASSDTAFNLELQRASATGRAQLVILDENGTAMWRFGGTAAGSEDWTFFCSNTSKTILDLKTDGTLNTPNESVYADNASALAGGLVVGDHYHTATGECRIVV